MIIYSFRAFSKAVRASLLSLAIIKVGDFKLKDNLNIFWALLNIQLQLQLQNSNSWAGKSFIKSKDLNLKDPLLGMAERDTDAMINLESTMKKVGTQWQQLIRKQEKTPR